MHFGHPILHQREVPVAVEKASLDARDVRG
jgi:hypothetical protein